jgi:hypothetical protein
MYCLSPNVLKKMFKNHIYRPQTCSSNTDTPKKKKKKKKKEKEKEKKKNKTNDNKKCNLL